MPRRFNVGARNHLASLVLGLLWLVGCAPERFAPDDAGTMTSQVAGLTADELANAMMAPEVRTGIFRALKSSPYSEHKVVLQELILRPEGEPLVRALAVSRGQAEFQVVGSLLAGPALDLYIPGASHRVQWTGAEVPAVADTREYRNGSLPVSMPSGLTARIDPRVESTREVLLLLQPAEPKAWRISLYSEVASSGVQAAMEPQEGGLVIRTSLSGRRDTIQLAELARRGRDPDLQLAQACPDDHPEWCEGGGSGGGGTGQNDPVWQTLGTTYLTTIATEHICDNNMCGLGDDNEFEFTGSWRYGNVADSNTIRRTGVPSSGIVSGLHLWLLNRKTTPHAPIFVELVETDAVGDDEFGRLYLTEADLNQYVFWGIPTVTPYIAAKFTW